MRKCSVIGCFNDKTKSDCRDKTFFSFPLKNYKLLQLWLKKIGRQNFKPTPNSVICSDHFEETSFTICRFTKRRLLKRDAVPNIFQKTSKQIPRINLLSLTLATNGTKPITPGAISSISNSPLISSESSNSQGNPGDKGNIKQMGAVNLQDQVQKEESKPISSTQKPNEKLNLQKQKYLTVISNKNVILLPLHFNQTSTTTSGIESQNVPKTPTVIKQEPDEYVDEPPTAINPEPDKNVDEPPIVIKQEPDEYIDEPPLPIIEKVSGTEVTASSSNSSLSSISVSSARSSPGPTPVLINPLPCTNVDSTNMDVTPTVRVVNKPAQKRKINDAELDAVPAAAVQAESSQLTKPPKLSSIHILRPTHLLLDAKKHPKHTGVTSKKSGRISNANQSELWRRTKPSKDTKLQQHPPVETPKGQSTSLFQKDDSGITETFQSLLDGSDSNPLFGSRIPERPGDLFDVFADFIAGKLRGMDWDDCAHALRIILEVVSTPDKVKHDSKVKRDVSSSKTTLNQE